MKFRVNKKGHFDFITLVIAIVGGVVAYLIAQTHLVKKLSGDKFKTKSEKNLRVRE